MADYNPHAPRDLGQEWVPIKQSNYIPDNVTERGYTFTIAHTVTPVSGSYNIAVGGNQRHLLALYPAGQEHLTGPIKQVVIPISGAVVTGSGTSVVGAATATLALTNPSDSQYVEFTSISGADLGVSFDTPSYAAQLNGKRILDITILYQIASTPTNLASSAFSVRRATPSTAITYATGLEGTLTLNTSPVNDLSIGDINFFWDSTSVNPISTIESYPWRYNELALFDASAGAFRLIGDFQISVPDATRSVQLGYVAMQVTYCEETRIRYGARSQFTPVGSQFVRMRDTNYANPALSPGQYTLTSVGRAPTVTAPSAFPTTDHAIRQLYELPTLVGVNVSESLTVGDTFTKARTDIIPDLALHTASAVVTGSHVYGNQIGAPVYGTVTAVQDIEDDPATGGSYPQVRFYARRFGNTTVPLTLRSVAATGTAVSISVTDFDALPEIVDGWREVTLRFSGTAPVFTATGGAQAWQWDAVGETAGNQWQVLGCDGPSPSAPQSYGAATYWAPNGATVELTWMSPAVSGVTTDSLSDAVLIFALDPPTVTGFTITTLSQPITGIALKCGTPPRCVPTGISYHRVTWSPVSIAVTGFGQYELQRFDSLDNEWQTIMTASSPSVTGFNDYEARVGILSQYRIRACDVLDFCGAWTTGSGTIPAPGVATTGSGAGVLIFTSNADQAGAYNLAYCMQFGSGGAVEEFAFPEAGTVAFQDMYNKDFPTAFKQLERGGEQFSRTLLIHAAAISPEKLADFRSLRDMAWADVPYIAVRDELGDRWYATVMVPAGNVRRNRTLYFAQVDVVETTDTAYPVPL